MPCGPCNACCRTFHQIHIRPGEKRARKRLPKEYLTVARGLPPGYLLLGYTEDGACPVRIGGRCTIYEDRPLVCRTYDCRLYAANGRGAGPRRDRRAGASLALHVPGGRGRRATGGGARGPPVHPGDPSCLPGEAARRQPIRLATLAVVTHELFRPGATRGARRRPVTDRDWISAVADGNEELFGDG